MIIILQARTVLSIVAIRLSGSPISPGGDMVKAATNLVCSSTAKG